MSFTASICNKNLPAQAGRFLLSRQPTKALQEQFFRGLLLCFCFFFASVSHAAIVIQSQATLASTHAIHNAIQVKVVADYEILRIEDIAFYRYDANASQHYTVQQNNLANQASYQGTPTLGLTMPAPLHPETGGSLFSAGASSASLPLTAAPEYEYQGLEPIFVIVKNPILTPSIDAQGRGFIAVTLNINTGEKHYTITLIETANGSGEYVGYLQPNIIDGPVAINPASKIAITDYEEKPSQSSDYLPDADAADAPWHVDVANLMRPRAGTTSNKPLVQNQLFLTKQAQRSSAAIGDFIAYDLSLTNQGDNFISAIHIDDYLPHGFRYQNKSARLEGTAITPDISADGSTLTLPIGGLAKGQSVRLRYVVEVSAQAKTGKAINTAVAKTTSLQSNQANALVTVENPFFNDKAFLIGRVIAGMCGEDNAPGLEGVRLYMEDGTNVITDKHGRWHIEGVTPGTHVLQLDTDTLSPRYQLRQCYDNTRQAGNPISRFVNVQGGTLWQENWYIEVLPGIEENIQQQLISVMQDDGTLRVSVPIKSGEQQFERIVSQLFIPESLDYIPGSTTLDGQPVADIQPENNYHIFEYQSEKRFAEYRIGFRLTVDPDVTEDITQTLMVKSTAHSQSGEEYTVMSQNRVGIQRMKTSDNNITLRPRFASLSAVLSDEDIAAINRAVVPLMNKPNLYLTITGHSDNQAIRFNRNRTINDNYALSEARAQAVADYLEQLLQLEEDHIHVEGKGPDLPIADNNTAEGRALNRRVAVQFRFTERASDASANVIEGDSGISNDKQHSEILEKQTNPEEKPGFVNISHGMTFTQPIFSAIAQINSRLKVRLLLDGKEVPNSRIGMRLADEKTGLTRYTWVGLELDELGEHQLQVQGLDSFGNPRFEETISIRRNGKIKTVRLLEMLENAADGRSPIVAKFQILDEFDQPISSGVELEITAGDLRPLNANQNKNRLENRGNVLHVDKDGMARFEPVGDAGNYRISLAIDHKNKTTLDIPVTPDLRDWILVGFAEGTVGYNTLSGNMRDLKNEENHAYVKGETSFFARGSIKGEWLLTVAYDSRHYDDDSPLMHRIDPQKWYALYGDDTLRGHDAPSSKELYVRIERADFYALFGDYDTGLNMTELSQYQRTLTGIKTEYRGTHMSATGFAAQTDQGFIRDDIPADGTSGLYHLSQNRIVPGSDEIVIEVRDRFTNVVLETRSMMRYIDYNIDYIDGTLYFRSPLMVQDASFNPQRIVAKYEIEAGREKVVAGGRVSVHDAEKKLEVGLSAINDDTVGAQGKLMGVDATWKPNDAHTLKAEIAASRQNLAGANSMRGEAWLVEHEFTSEKVDTRVRVEETDGGFGLGQIAKDDDDIRKAIVSARYRITEQWSLNGDASHQKVISSNNQRDTVEGRVEYTHSDWQMFSGLRHAEDKTSNGHFNSEQIIAGARRSFMDKRLDLSIRGETGLSNSDNVDYPSLLSFGSDYKLTQSVALFANQDFTWGDGRNAQETRVGVRATPWQGGTISSDVSRAQDEYGPRLLAHAGLMQTVNLSSHWTGDFGFDRSQTIKDSKKSYESFDDRRPAAFGSSNSDDYTAVYLGAGYRDEQWQLTNRVEYRHADTDDKWTFMSGFEQRLSDTDTMAGRALHFNQKMKTGDRSQSTEIDFSYAHRPLEDAWIWLNRTKLAFDALNDSLGKQHGRRLVNNTHLNNTFGYQHQLSMQYGARYVLDTIDNQRFKGFTDLIAAEYRFDLTPQWDIGGRMSTLASYNSKVRYTSFGIMAGYSPIKNVWISLGYNFKGFYDKDFDGAESRVKGFVLDFRIKFDQNSAKQLLSSNP